jgi:hypothetical protein
MSDDRIRALRHAREIVDDRRWRGMAVPPVYARMADEFQAVVTSGAYTVWLAGSETARHQAARPGASRALRRP